MFKLGGITIFTKLGNAYLAAASHIQRKRHPSKKAQGIIDSNYVFNSKFDMADVIIDRQNSRNSPVAWFCMGHLGRGSRFNRHYPSLRDTGCEIIAVNNALLLHGQKNVSVAEITKRFGDLNAITKAPFIRYGDFGGNPFCIGRVLESYGVQPERLSSPNEIHTPSVYIMSYWNKNKSGHPSIFMGLHTIAFHVCGDGIQLFNFSQSNKKLTHDEFYRIFNGCFICGWKL